MISGAQNKKKARRSQKKKGYYAKQFYRTVQNKIRRPRKRLDFDPTAQAAINRLVSKPIPVK